MKFLVGRTSQGAFSATAPCPGATRGPEAGAWPGEYQWYIELDDLDALLAFLQEQGGALGLFTPEEGEDHPFLEIFDEEDEPDGTSGSVL